MEGRHKVETIEDMNLEKTWSGINCGNERFGSLGGYPTGKYFPMAVFEDTEAGICWAAAIESNCTFKINLILLMWSLMNSAQHGASIRRKKCCRIAKY